MLTDVLENFRNICLEVCELDAACFITAPRFANSLKKDQW